MDFAKHVCKGMVYLESKSFVHRLDNKHGLKEREKGKREKGEREREEGKREKGERGRERGRKERGEPKRE